MFESIKNKEQRSTLISLLTFIVGGTQSPAAFAFVPKSEAAKLHKVEPSFIVIDPATTNAEGQVKVTATKAAIDALNGSAKDQEAKPATSTKAATEPMKFEVVTLADLPPIMRGGAKSESYPFDQLKPFPDTGNAFFVPATEKRPNPAKTLASTVASATKRHAKTDGAVFTVRKHVDASGKVLGAHVIRTK